MKKVTLLSTLFVAGALTFTATGDTAQADEEEGAKTVWGETLPADTDPDGDGWANTDFDVAWMSEEAQDRVADLTEMKDSGEISQVEYNEKVASVFREQQFSQIDGPNEYIEHMEIDVTKESLASLALNSPGTLDAAPIHEEPYDYQFVYGDYEFHFFYDGYEWTWSYEEVKNDFTDEELMYLAHNDPEVLNQHPVKAGKYDFKLSDKKYVYHFASDGVEWTWSYKAK